MKVLVLGGSGMLGSMLVRYLAPRHEVTATYYTSSKPESSNVEWQRFDAIFNCKLVNICRLIHRADYVINCIGQIPQRTAVPSWALYSAINSVFPKLLASAAEEDGCRVIQIATDCVFSGSRGYYSEHDAHDAQDAYGLSKSMGESASSAVQLIRCSIIGPEQHGKSLMGWLLSQPFGAVVGGYTDHLWNGVTTLQFAKVCHTLMTHDKSLPSPQHFIPCGAVSKFELLSRIAHEYERDDITIMPRSVGMKNMILTTVNEHANTLLWKMAGYEQPPTIVQMIKELAEYSKVEVNA